MQTAHAGMIGQPPTLLVQPVVPKPVDGEQAKYEKMWSNPEYRNYAPGEDAANCFLQLAKPSRTDTIIDFGAGTGRGALLLAVLGNGAKVHMLDFAENCLDEDVRNALSTQSHIMSFQRCDLRDPSGKYAKYGFCTDVMEHIPPEDVDRVLHNVLKSAQHVFFQISTVPDHFGQSIGEHLHLTVQPHDWWLAKLKEHDAVIQWSSEGTGLCAFYVTAWQSTQELISHGTLNVEQETIKDNIKASMARGLRDVHPFEKTDIPVMILAGGPSMSEFADEIVERRTDGEKLITVNGAYNWAIERGMKPSAQVMVDSREFNKRFLSPAIPACHYLLASQCHPASFDSVPAEQTTLWHSAIDPEMLEYLEPLYTGTGKPWYPIMGGSTVMLRTLPLMVLLGYHRFEIFGWDSCLMNGEHHAYKQDENDHTTVIQVLVNGRTFHCHPWMVSQAQEFLDLMQLMSEHIELIVRGDGLISWLIETAAEDADVKIEVEQSL